VPHVQVTIACLWAALFNNLVLSWTTADWALEQMAAAVTAPPDVLAATCRLQFDAADAVTGGQGSSDGTRGRAGISGSSSSGGSQRRAAPRGAVDVMLALQAQEGTLQRRLIEPAVGVQTALAMELHVWGARRPTRAACKRTRRVALAGRRRMGRRHVLRVCVTRAARGRMYLCTCLSCSCRLLPMQQ
jgi:hypothetical protein